MSNIDWSKLITREMKIIEAERIKNEKLIQEEKDWSANEFIVISEQLVMLEDDDPNALPGTDRQWRDYRIALRQWKEGAQFYPDMNYRPKRPK